MKNGKRKSQSEEESGMRSSRHSQTAREDSTISRNCSIGTSLARKNLYGNEQNWFRNMRSSPSAYKSSGRNNGSNPYGISSGSITAQFFGSRTARRPKSGSFLRR